MQLTGIHHLTAVSANAPGNLRFYTQVMGMRLIKKTVNQDDVSAYHLFYGDGVASPGSDLTFFDFPAAPERRGNHTRHAHRAAGGRPRYAAMVAPASDRGRCEDRRDRRARRPLHPRLRGP